MKGDKKKDKWIWKQVGSEGGERKEGFMPGGAAIVIGSFKRGRQLAEKKTQKDKGGAGAFGLKRRSRGFGKDKTSARAT